MDYLGCAWSLLKVGLGQNFGLTTVDLRWFDLYSGLVEICCFSFGFVQDWLPSSSLLMLGESCFKALVFVEQKW